MKQFVIIIVLFLTGTIGIGADAQLTVTTPGLTTGQCVQSDSSSDIVDGGCTGRTHVLTDSGSLPLSNSDCGAYIVSISTGPAALTLPASPLNGCTFTIDTSLGKFYVNTSPLSSKLIPASLLGYSQALYQFTLQSASVEKSYYVLQYDGQEWRTADFSVHGHDL